MLENEIKQYCLGLMEYDLTSDVNYFEQQLKEANKIKDTDKIEYKWLDKDFNDLAICIIGKEKTKTFKIEINVKEIK